MKSVKYSVVAVAVGIALALSVSAQQQSNDNHDQQIQGTQRMLCGMMQRVAKRGQGMISVMQACRQKMRSMMQSNDRSKMHAPLDEADKGLNSMTGHMNSCMGMMQNMNGMDGMMSGHQKSENTNSPRP